MAVKHTFTVKELLALDDSDLMDVLGLRDQITEFRNQLDKARDLNGTALQEFETWLNKKLQPRVFPEHLAEGIRMAKDRKSEKAPMVWPSEVGEW